ncbi:hypothetical protein [Hydrocarboniphaga sp.]|uniref:hypothetical protein n=1 Tax=Hydrocarboniphaga sp. TaxID=2033016 RepID=UPI003D108ECE
MSEVTEKSLHEQQEDGADFGNFYPTHHVLLAFEQKAQADGARDGLRAAGFDDVREIDDQRMISASQHGLDTASLIAAMGSSLKMVELHNTLAKEGCHFLLVKAESNEDTEKLMTVVRKGRFRLAQKYKRLVIETLE